MGPIARISIRPDAPLLNGVVGECLAAGVLAVPDGLRGPIGESDHVVLPILSVFFGAFHFISLLLPVTNMIPEFQTNHRIAFVVPRTISVPVRS